MQVECRGSARSMAMLCTAHQLEMPRGGGSEAGLAATGQPVCNRAYDFPFGTILRCLCFQTKQRPWFVHEKCNSINATKIRNKLLVRSKDKNENIKVIGLLCMFLSCVFDV